jgi:hypothetical protein
MKFELIHDFISGEEVWYTKKDGVDIPVSLRLNQKEAEFVFETILESERNKKKPEVVKTIEI